MGCLRTLAVLLCRALPKFDWLDILRHNFLCSPTVLIRHVTAPHWTQRYRRVPRTPMELRDIFVRLEVILGYFPACREAQALLVAMQLCAHCLALTVPAATVGSFDPAPHFRRMMREALERDSINGQYARPRDYYAVLFAPNTPLDDESYTAAGCSVALTQGFLLRPCHLQLPLWLATSPRPVPFLRTCFDILHGWLDLDHASPEGLGDAGTHARFGRRLTLATGFVMVPPLLGASFLG